LKPSKKCSCLILGERLYAKYWYPKDMDNIRGLVFICHGYAEHLDDHYDQFAAALASLNIVGSYQKFYPDYNYDGIFDVLTF
jgi:hypothetical protein